MGEPCNWTVVPGECCPSWGEYTPGQQARAIRVGTALMWAATGRQFGLCEISVQPCAPAGISPSYRVYPVTLGSGFGEFHPYLWAGRWYNPGVGACGCCEAGCEIPLQGPTSTDAVVEVVVAGVVVPPAAYIIMDSYRLVRIDGACWPTCVNYSQQDPPGFEVTYGRGTPVPQVVLDAAAQVACEAAKACAGGDCVLPANVTSITRQGVEFDVAEVDITTDRLSSGIPEVDRVIAIYNPHRLTQRTRIYGPDVRYPRMVT